MEAHRNGKRVRALRKDRNIKVKVAHLMELPQEQQTQFRLIICAIEKNHPELLGKEGGNG